MTAPSGLPVGDLLAPRPDSVPLTLTLVAGRSGLHRLITSPSIQKTGLALAGFHEYLRPGRVLLFGESEVHYLATLTPDQRRSTLDTSLATGIPCLLITGDEPLPAEVAEAAEQAGVPLLTTTASTAAAMSRISALLEDRLAVRETVHGVLVDVLGLGVLMTGESGIGKSECALDLVVRGHRLVADDVVEIRRRSDAIVLGSCPELGRHHMEIRGIGLINIRDLYGIAATRGSKRVELVVHLERWSPEQPVDRLGIDDTVQDLLGVRIPLIRMPVAPGRNLSILVEVAARNQLLRARGIHAARSLVSRLAARLTDGAAGSDADEPDDTEGDPLL